MSHNQRSNNNQYHGQGQGQGYQGGASYQQQHLQQHQQQYYPQDYNNQGQQYQQQQFYPPGYQQQHQPYYPQDYYQQQQQYNQYNEYEGIDDPDQLMMDELEREMDGLSSQHQQYHQPQQYSYNSSQKPSSASYVPQGAMPSINGKLTNAAAEFWFPECRNCECCAGYKHGCKCCLGGVTECSCVTGGAPPSAPAPPSSTSFAPRQTGTSYLPSGAVPSMGGKLTKAAAEFWFPECRNCECCTGYKHGCKCCVGDVTECSCVIAAASSVPNSDTATDTPAATTTTDTAPSTTSFDTKPDISSNSTPVSTSDSSISSSEAVVTEKVAATPDPTLWYSECKKCSCCKGFVHNCACVNTRKEAKCLTCSK